MPTKDLTLAPPTRIDVARSTTLRRALRLDATVTGANGIGYLVAAAQLDSLLGIDAATLRIAGVLLLAFGGVLWVTSNRRSASVAAVGTLIAANVLWVADSFATVAFDWLTPTTAGAVWIVLQAITVAGFAGLQLYGLRRAEHC